MDEETKKFFELRAKELEKENESHSRYMDDLEEIFEDYETYKHKEPKRPPAE